MEALEVKHLRELALRAVYTGQTQFTRFLDPSAESDVCSAAHEAGAKVQFFGGYKDAERRIAAFYVDNTPPEAEEYPLVPLQLCWNAKFTTAEHRDLLGAVMGLGLEREVTGDICLGMDEGCAYLFTIADMADYIAVNLESAGRAKLTIRRPVVLHLRPAEGIQMRATVQNLRMDAVLAAGYHLSRAEAQRLIAGGLVKRNHIPEMRTDIRLNAGDLLSARGYGRLRIDEIQGETRKGRIGLLIFRYGK